MLLSLDQLDSGAETSAEICVIGAGAAGQTVAKALADRGHEVLIVESGGVDFDATIQELNRADNIGLAYYELYRARLRFFGGTTAIWGGRTCRLDPIDFAPRDWVPMSGWPITGEQLEPFYKQAEARLFEARNARTESNFRDISHAPGATADGFQESLPFPL